MAELGYPEDTIREGVSYEHTFDPTSRGSICPLHYRCRMTVRPEPTTTRKDSK